MRTKASVHLILGTLLTCLAVACGTRSEGPAFSPVTLENAGIVNGTPEKSDSVVATHTVALRSKNEREVFCTATVLAKRVLLTAAHCFEGFEFNRDEVEAVFDVDADSAGALAIGVAKIRIHDDYAGFPKENLCPFGGCEKLTPKQFAGEHRAGDLALLLLKSDVPDRAAPVSIANEAVTAGALKKGTVAGYGASTFGKKFSQIGGYGKLRSMRAELEYLETPAKFLVRAGKQAVCFGDSGGPLFARVGDRLKQIGVASHLADASMQGPCGASGAAYTSTAAYADWIRASVEAILAQKNAVEAPWLKIRLNRPKVLADGPEWFDSFVKSVDLACEGKDLKWTSHAELEPYFKGAQAQEGEPGTGSFSGTLERGSRVDRFNLFQRDDEEGAQFTFDFKDASAVWKKTGGQRDRAFAAALDGGAHAFSVFRNGLLLEIKTASGRPFRVTAISRDRVDLRAEKVKLTRKGPDAREPDETEAACRLKIGILPHR